MDRRFFIWFLLLTSIFFLWSSSRQRAELKLQQDRAAAELRAEQDRESAEKAKLAMSKLVSDTDVAPPPEEPLAFYSLGSMTPEDQRPLMLTLSNAGASLDRIELMARTQDGGFLYRSLDSKFGFPGYLALKSVAGGLRIQHVPPGSPAQLARNTDPTAPSGMKSGDILTQIDGFNVRSLADYYVAIRKTDPGKIARMTIIRSNSSGDTPAPEPSGADAALGNKDEADTAVEEPVAEISAATELSETSELAQLSSTRKINDALNQPTRELLLMPELEKIDKPAEQPIDGQPVPLGAEDGVMEFEVALIEQPLEVIRNSNNYPAEQVSGNLQRGSLLTTLASIDGISVPEGKRFISGLDEMMQRNWIAKPSKDGNAIDFELPLVAFLKAAGIDADLTMVKSYRLKSFNAEDALANYDFELTTTIRNNRDKPVSVALRQEGLSGLTVEGWWYSVKQSTEFMNAAGAIDVMVARVDGEHELFTRRSIQTAAKLTTTNRDLPILGPADRLESRSLRYIGVDSQYFVAAMLPSEKDVDGLSNLNRAAAMAIANVTPPNELAVYKDIAMNVGYYIDSPVATISADKPLEITYRIFAGPKDPLLLSEYGLSDTIYYGWSIFGLVAKPLSSILHFFYNLVMNYGIAIMMLTVLVRSCMFPLSWRAAAMGQRMQEMAPEIKKINELYKEDFQKRGVETQKLYKKYKLNPMASCLPVFIQLPIFIGLYRTVSTDVALRQKPLIAGWEWCSNLAGPDQFLLWPAWMPEFLAGKGTGWFGPYFNLLPIITCLLFIIQQKVLMPKATDEQTLMTQRIMMFMTVFMGVLFFRVPAGLCIYFITSSIWSLIERTLVKKFLPSIRPAIAADGVAIVEPVALAPYKPKPVAKPRKPTEKPPEKLSELFPWLKRQIKSNSTMDNPRPTGGNSASKDIRPISKNRKRKKLK